MGSGDREVVDRVKAAVDIVDVATGYFPLIRRGDRYTALCPFHREKTPSFSILASRQIFHCFGCGKSGDVLTLVMEMDRLTFPEALRELAGRAGIAIESGRLDRDEQRRLRGYGLMQAAAEFYTGCLRTPAAQHARAYVERRGLTPATIDRFGIGYAPEGWQALSDAMRARGYHEDELLACGLSRQNPGKRAFDLLRDRLVIPIRDARGRVIGFGGRILGDGEPKYLNSPESELFSKRTVLYAFDVARSAAAAQGEFVVVEGYMDAIAAHQHGIHHVVGTLGTSLTREHAHQMLRYAKRAVLLFDGDEGGRRAADRGAPIVLQEGLDVSVATLPAGMDPDDFLREHGAEAFRGQLRAAAEDLISFLIRRARERNPGTDIAEVARATREVLAQIGELRDPIRHDLFLTRISQAFGVDERLVRREAMSLPAANAGAPAPPTRAPAARRLRGFELDEIFILLGATTEPTFATSVLGELLPIDFRDPAHRRIFVAMGELVKVGRSVAPSILLDALKEDAAALAALERILGREIPTGDSPDAARQRILRRRQEVDYRKMREEAARSGVLHSAEDEELDRRLAELAQFHASRYARSKDLAREHDSNDKL